MAEVVAEVVAEGGGGDAVADEVNNDDPNV
jgi:hypothetical protein